MLACRCIEENMKDMDYRSIGIVVSGSTQKDAIAALVVDPANCLNADLPHWRTIMLHKEA
jgi:hypothetical protein